MVSRDEFIVEVWEGLGAEVVSAAELGVIEGAVIERFGFGMSPASIARVLADQGAVLGHPEILQADMRWREKQSLFTAEELDFGNLDAALGLARKIERLGDDPSMRENLRQAVRSLKAELDSLSSDNQLAAEVSQWLTVWLQNPQIFAEWLTLRQNTPDFRTRFLS